MRLELEADNTNLRAVIDITGRVMPEEFDEFREALWKMTAAMREHLWTLMERDMAKLKEREQEKVAAEERFQTAKRIEGMIDSLNTGSTP